MAKMSRRNFLKFVMVSGGALIVADLTGLRLIEALSKNPDSISTSPAGKRYGMVIDIGACVGCRKCMHACKEINNIPDNMAWVEVFELNNTTPISELSAVPPNESTTTYTQSPQKGKWYLPVNCYHCDDPPCVKVCPVGATFKGQDGLVEMNYDRCIGCRNCVTACPYNARRFNWSTPVIPSERVNPEVPLRPAGVVEKCTFCQQRTRNNKLPRCVEVCPVNARHFGDLNDKDSNVTKILNSEISYRILDELNTKPKLFYIMSGKKWFPGG